MKVPDIMELFNRIPSFVWIIVVVVIGYFALRKKK